MLDLGSMALIWFGFWIFFTSECPEDHKTISSEELSYLNCTIGLSYMQYQVSLIFIPDGNFC